MKKLFFLYFSLWQTDVCEAATESWYSRKVAEADVPLVPGVATEDKNTDGLSVGKDARCTIKLSDKDSE